eukprot:gene4810-15107_t
MRERYRDMMLRLQRDPRFDRSDTEDTDKHAIKLHNIASLDGLPTDTDICVLGQIGKNDDGLFLEDDHDK